MPSLGLLKRLIFATLVGVIPLASMFAAPRSHCASKVQAAYSSRSFEGFFNLTQYGSNAPVVTPDRLGEWVGDTKRMAVYRRPRELRAEDYYYFVRPKSRKLIGVVNISLMERDSVINVYFNRYYQNRRYGSEAYSFALPLIMKSLPGKRLTAIIAEGNDASVRFHENFGFQKELGSQIWVLRK